MQSLMLLAAVVRAADPVPADEDVTAGWTALLVFLGLAVAVAVLGWSLTNHLRKARENAERGVFGPPADEKTDRQQDAENQP